MTSLKLYCADNMDTGKLNLTNVLRRSSSSYRAAGAKLPAFTNVLPSGPLFIGLPISGSTPIISHSHV